MIYKGHLNTNFMDISFIISLEEILGGKDEWKK